MGSGWEGWKSITQTQPDLSKQIDCAVLRANPDQLKSAVDSVIQDLMRSECAVTAQDFERFSQQLAQEYAERAQRQETSCSHTLRSLDQS